MAIAKLSIDIEARLAKLQQSIDQSVGVIERGMGRVQSVVGVAGAALGALGGALSVTAVSAWARAIIDGVDALNDLADAAGTTIENASALEDIALRTGTAYETVTGAVVRFNAQLAATRDPGSEASRIFQRLGLDAQALRDADPAEALLAASQALAKYADDGNKARLVQELFGKSVSQVAPFLKDLAEAGRLNATVTAEQAKQAEQFNREIFALQKNLTDLSRLALGPVVETVNDFAAAVRRASGDTSTFSQRIAGLVDAASKLGFGALFGLGGGGGKDEIAEAEADVARFERLLQRVDLTAERRRQLEAGLAGRQQRLSQLRSGAAAGFRPSQNYGERAAPSVGELPTGNGAARAARGAAERAELMGPELPQATADAIRRIADADEAKIARLRDTIASLTEIIRGGGQVPDSVFAGITEELTRLDPAARAAAEAQRALAERTEEARRIFEATRTPAEELATRLEKLQRLLSTGDISPDTWGRALEQELERLGQILDKPLPGAERAGDAARQLGLSFSSAFEEAIVKGGKLSDLLRSLEQDILRIVTRKLVTEPLAEGIGSVLKGGLGGIGSIFSGLFAGFFADGGYIPPGRWGMTGERGPEPVFGGRAGVTVRPAAAGNTININVQGAPGASWASQQQQAALIGRQVQLALARNG